MKTEIWKDIPDYEGFYQISNLGNIKSMSRLSLRQGKYPFITEECVLKPRINKGYLVITLYKDGIKKSKSIHQLVAMTFLNHTPNGLKIVVDHIDNNRLNNNLSNLQLISNRENASKDKKGYSSQYVGVSWSTPKKKYRAAIVVNNKSVHLGYFNNEIEAHLCYQKALKMLEKEDLSFTKSKDKSSKYKGVSWNKKAKKWVVSIPTSTKPKYLGAFDNEEDAHKAYINYVP